MLWCWLRTGNMFSELKCLLWFVPQSASIISLFLWVCPPILESDVLSEHSEEKQQPPSSPWLCCTLQKMTCLTSSHIPPGKRQHHRELQKYWHHQTSVSKEEMNPGLPRSCLGLIGLAGHDEMQSMTSAALQAEMANRDALKWELPPIPCPPNEIWRSLLTAGSQDSRDQQGIVVSGSGSGVWILQLQRN